MINSQPRLVLVASSVHMQIVTGSQSFLPEVFRAKLLCFIVVLHILFSIIERNKFRDLILYLLFYLGHNNSVLKSSISISTGLVTSFLAC
jgi:hypothetical protein